MILGIIAVYKCDGCGAIKTLHTDIDLAGFSKWFSGKKHDFCPECHLTSRKAEKTPEINLATERIVALVNRRINGNASLRIPHSALEKEAA